LGTVMKVSHAVAEEIVLENLIETLMVVAVEHAGADRGLLILPSEEEFLIAAEAKTERDRIDVELRDLFVTPSDLPDSLLRYVTRTQESVILDDASVQNSFSDDEYFLRHYPRSVLCLPLVKQAKLMGALYLENKLAPGAFTPKRLTMLDLLASQAAISLEHARLYTGLGRLNAELTKENSDRRKAEEALRASEERWRKLFETSSAGIALVALDGRYLAANLALQKMLGYTEEELRGLTTPKVTHEEDRPETEAILAECVEGRPRSYRQTKRYRRKDGSVIWADVSSTMVPATGDKPGFFATVVVDITERKRAEEELRNKEISLREAQSELAHVSRVTMMGELAASIAHEVSQPLAGIVTNANASLRWLGAESPNLEEARESIRRIIRDGNRSSDVVSRMRTLFKKVYTATESLDINQAIEEVVTLTEREVQRSNVTLYMELAPDLPPVTGDRVQLQQVVLNLFLNGIEAMRGLENRARNLIIRTQRGEAGEVRVAVQDSGIGFDPDSAERMFDPFHTTKPGGLGMGLSISRSIVESHGGRLWAVSNDGPGATFQFTLFERPKN
jgi:PAS domain S-box-containing protein